MNGQILTTIALPNIIDNKYLNLKKLSSVIFSLYENLFIVNKGDYSNQFLDIINHACYTYNISIDELIISSKFIGINCIQIIADNIQINLENIDLKNIITYRLLDSNTPIESILSITNPSKVIDDDINILIYSICLGKLSTVQQIIKRFDLSIKGILIENEDLLAISIQYNHLHILKYLIETSELSIEKIRCHEDYLFAMAIEYNCPDIFKWLAVKCNFTVEDITSDYDLFITMAGYGRLDIIQWLVETFDLVTHSETCKIAEAFPYAVSSGDLDTIKYIVTTFNLTINEIKIWMNTALVSSARHGYLDIIQWLIEKFSLTFHGSSVFAKWINNKYVSNIHDIDEDYIYLMVSLAANNGYLDVVQWMINNFDFDIKRKDYNLFLSAIIGGNLEIVQWLVDRFDLNEFDIRHNGNHADQFALNELGLNEHNIRDKGNQAVILAITYGHLHVLKWLFARFGLGINDLRRKKVIAILVAISNNQLDNFQWLNDRFDLTPEDIRRGEKRIIRWEEEFEQTPEDEPLPLQVDPFDLSCKKESFIVTDNFNHHDFTHIMEWIKSEFDFIE